MNDNEKQERYKAIQTVKYVQWGVIDAETGETVRDNMTREDAFKHAWNLNNPNYIKDLFKKP